MSIENRSACTERKTPQLLDKKHVTHVYIFFFLN